jgi:Uma2 family endonuclease
LFPVAVAEILMAQPRPTPIPEADPPDPFRFGWRYAPGTNGKRIPLTPADLLHPQENDQIPENTLQKEDRTYLTTVLRNWLNSRPNIRVLSDCLIDWGVPGLGNHSPDLCVMENVTDPRRVWSTFRVAVEGARPVLTVEIVSADAHDPQRRNNDVEIKVREYYRAGVPLYAIIDMERTGGPRRLVGYRRGKRRYLPLRLDAEGRLPLEPLGLLLGLRDNRAICFNAATGEALLELSGMTQAWQQAEEARHQAEEQRAAEALARQQAEQALQQAEEARRQAEQARAAEAQARQESEAALTARIRELEAQAQRRRPPRGRKS